MYGVAAGFTLGLCLFMLLTPTSDYRTIYIVSLVLMILLGIAIGYLGRAKHTLPATLLWFHALANACSLSYGIIYMIIYTRSAVRDLNLIFGGIFFGTMVISILVQMGKYPG